METSLNDYLINSSDYSDEELKKTSNFPVETEKFCIENILIKKLIENINKFFTLKGYNFSKGHLDDTFQLEKNKRIIAVISIISLISTTSSLVKVTPTKIKVGE